MLLDGRNPALMKHSIAQILAQRVYGPLGYEDTSTITSNYGMPRCSKYWRTSRNRKVRWRARAP
jgi:hypothetical protein